MKKKKAIMASTLVVITILLVVFVILLRLDLHIVALLRAGTEGGVCAWSAVFSSFSDVAGTKPLKIVCPQRYVRAVLTTDELKQDEVEEYFAIDKPIPPEQRKKLAEWDPDHDESYFAQEGVYREYRLNEIMANEMKICWSKLGRGELNLFSSWFDKWIPLEYIDDPDEVQNKLRYFWVWDIGFVSRKVCVICSRVKFDDKVNSKFKGKTITNLGDWLRKHPVNPRSPRPISYYEFLMDETIPSNFFAKDADMNRYYYTTDEPQAIVFLRMGVHKLIDMVPIFNEDEIDAVFITPYSAVKDKCDIIAN